MQELAFDNYTEVREFLQKYNAAIFKNAGSPDPDKNIDCKTASGPLAQAFEEKYRKVQIKGAI